MKKRFLFINSRFTLFTLTFRGVYQLVWVYGQGNIFLEMFTSRFMGKRILTLVIFNSQRCSLALFTLGPGLWVEEFFSASIGRGILPKGLWVKQSLHGSMGFPRYGQRDPYTSLYPWSLRLWVEESLHFFLPLVWSGIGILTLLFTLISVFTLVSGSMGRGILTLLFTPSLRGRGILTLVSYK